MNISVTESAMCCVEKEVLDILEEEGLRDSSLVGSVQSAFRKHYNPLEGLNTAYHQAVYMSRHFPYVVSCYVCVNVLLNVIYKMDCKILRCSLPRQ